MQPILDAIERVYIQRIEDLKSRIEDMKKEKRTLLLLTVVLVAFICLLFGFDVLNPNAGWFRY